LSLIIYSNCVLLKLWIYGNISTYIQPRIGSKNGKNRKIKKRVVFVMKLDDEQYSFFNGGKKSINYNSHTDKPGSGD